MNSGPVGNLCPAGSQVGFLERRIKRCGLLMWSLQEGASYIVIHVHPNTTHGTCKHIRTYSDSSPTYCNERISRYTF